MSPPETDLPAWDMRMMLLIHAALLRDFKLIRESLDEPPTSALLARWQLARDILHHHQQAEDSSLWPLLESRAADDDEARGVLMAMQSEHREIDPMVAVVDESITQGADLAILRRQLDRLIAAMQAHFAHEEQAAMPLLARSVPLAQRREFERQQRESIDPEQRLMFFPWLVDGADTADAAFVWTTVPWFVRRLVRGKGERQYRELTLAAFGEEA